MYSNTGNKSKKVTVALIIFIILFLMTVFIGFIVPLFFEKLTESNTIELTATVDNIEIIKIQNKYHYIINTSEYGKKLMVRNSKEIINIENFNNIKEGQIIIFRIEKQWAEKINEIEFVYIVTLKTEDEEVITFNSINAQHESDILKIRIAAVIFGAIFLSVSIHCILSLEGINILKKKPKQA
jgi:predicted permease